MARIEITLAKSSWTYDPDTSLGEPGGFGEVFIGYSDDGAEVAIKRLHFDAMNAARRELRIANELSNADLVNVIPILDSGLDEETGRYFIVMPLADKSLQQELSHRGKLPLQEVIDIMLSILNGLNEVPDIVHRDLKPDNVLFHAGAWKIADFGIAKFIEESTSLNTLKNALTPQYAAPEQWNLETADSSTDIYALGCIGYALLTGKPPFEGPQLEDFRRQHLTEAALPLPQELSNINVLLLSMLRKQHASRPANRRVTEALNQISQNSVAEESGLGLQALAKAGADVALERARVEAERSATQEALTGRLGLAEAAMEILQQVLEKFAGRIIRTTIIAERDTDSSHPLVINLGSATLEVRKFADFRLIPEGAFPNSGWDVIIGAIISVHQSEPNEFIWSANLWYTDRGLAEGYRWWEICYKAVAGRRVSYQPFALTELKDADLAASNIMHSYSFAARPKPIDDEAFESFVNRWADLLAKASSGEMRHPPRLPLD